MIILLLALAYIACGLCSVALGVWLFPDTYREGDPRSYELDNSGPLLVLTLALWPVAWVFIAAATIRRAVLNAKDNQTRVRAELEKELAAARKEVEDLLRRKTA